MRITATALLICLLACTGAAIASEHQESGESEKKPEKASEILSRLEDRYAGKNFSADFRQESTLDAMDITDEASGIAWFKHPGKMRWEYREPERQVIVSDGEKLWIYRPAENQVMVGKASNYFGGGQGAGFLADFGKIEELFEASVRDCNGSSCRIRLVPRRKRQDVAEVHLEINTENLDIKQVETENIYGDVTRLFFQEPEFHPEIKDGLFEFAIPSGTEVFKMEQ